MDQEELENLMDDYGYFELDHLCWGNLTIKVYQPYVSQMKIEFDEVIGDCVPGMVQMYNALKHRKPYAFYSAAGDGYYVFEIRDFAKDGDEEFVFFSIAAGKGDIWEGELRHRTEICSDVPVNYLLYEFEIFFRTLLHHPDFPFQFPGFICMDDKQSNEASAQADEIFKKLELTDDEYLELEKKCIREHVTKFDDIGEELIKKYKKMLTEYKVPDGWIIFRRSGQETDHSF